MAQKKSQVQNFEKVFDYTLFLGKYLPTFKCSSQNSTSVDTLFNRLLDLMKRIVENLRIQSLRTLQEVSFFSEIFTRSDILIMYLSKKALF